MNFILLVVGAVFIIIWGVAHLFPTSSVIDGFGNISTDNKLILKMEWINEGLTLIFIGCITIISAIYREDYLALSKVINFASAIMLLSMAILSFFTGFKVKFLPYKLCPIIFIIAALLITLGALL